MKHYLSCFCSLVLLFTFFSSLLHAEEERKLPEWMVKTLKRNNGAQETFKAGDGRDLDIFVMKGKPNPDGKKKPVLILYHGGGWGGGAPSTMVSAGAGFVSEDFVVVAPQTRLFVKDQPEAVTLHDVMDDAYRAAAWVIENAERLGVDPQRVYLGGTSAGGHLASSVALIGNPKNPSLPAIPTRGLVLYNPVVDTGPEGYGNRAASRVGDYKLSSPVDHVTANAPPAIIFHGTADKVVKIANARKFRDAMVAAGVPCELIEYEGEPHGLINTPTRGKMQPEAVRFLKERENAK